jgi:trehalose 6-phosphate synthase
MTDQTLPGTSADVATDWDMVVIASNRGPIEYQRLSDGRIRAARGAGGVVTALAAIAARMPLTWIAAPITDADRLVADGAPAPTAQISQQFVAIDRATYRRYYERFANGLLWFLQHYMLDTSHEPRIDEVLYRAWESGYVPANEAFTHSIVEAIRGTRRPLVLVQDYHLYLVPTAVREAKPEATIQHFTHIPWPEPRYWQLIPGIMREAICRGLCGCDIVGFQTRRDARNFVDCCQEFLSDVRVDRNANRIFIEGREVLVRTYPISIDADRLRRFGRSIEVRRARERLKAMAGDLTVVRVDRMEPSKNIVRGFAALNLLFQRRPDLVGKVRMLAFLVPSREAVPIYREYREEVLAIVEMINQKYGTESWTPVSIFYENNYPQSMAALGLYDVLLVNPVIDGMNLVAKEGPIVNERNGVLVLSEGAGAHDQLGEWALSVSPADVLGTARALEEALSMSESERSRRAASIRDAIGREDINWWLDRQLADLATRLAEPLPRGSQRPAS